MNDVTDQKLLSGYVACWNELLSCPFSVSVGRNLQRKTEFFFLSIPLASSNLW